MMTRRGNNEHFLRSINEKRKLYGYHILSRKYKNKNKTVMEPSIIDTKYSNVNFKERYNCDRIDDVIRIKRINSNNHNKEKLNGDSYHLWKNKKRTFRISFIRKTSMQT